MERDRLNNEETAGNQGCNEQAGSGEPFGIDPNLRLIRLFNHYRHDWMNDIQVLFGYVKLKKYDKLEHLMEKIKAKVQRESHLTKLGVPKLVVYLLMVQTEVKDLQLDVEMLQEIHLNELPLDTASFCRLLTGLIEAFKGNAEFQGDGEHRLSIELFQKSDRLQVDLNYQGEIAVERLRPELDQIKLRYPGELTWEVKLFDERHSVIQIEVPFRQKEVDSCL